jgi:hypothetical protein
MVLDVESPDPPDLTNRGLPSDLDIAELPGNSNDLRREELETVLREGAWNEAFQEWAAYTDLTEGEYRTLQDHGLLQALDFYWDPVDEQLRFEVPELPGEFDREDLAAMAQAELTDLGHTVVEMIEDAYTDWGGMETEAPWTEELFEEEPTGEG